MLELDFWKCINKKGFDKPTTVAIEKSLKIMKYYKKINYYEAYFFQLDITVKLYEIINDFESAYKLEKSKIQLLNFLKMPRQN